MIFKEAMEIYQKKTKKDLTSHRLTSKLQSCSGPDAIIDMLRNMLGAQSTDEKLTKWLDPTVNVLCAFSDTIGSAAGLVTTPNFKPARDLPSDLYDLGIPPCDHNIFWDRNPSTSERRP